MSEHILSLSYGKDSLACLGAIEKLGLPLDRIIHAEVWATDTIPADLPPMVEFKAKADEIIKSRWGIEVEHISADVNYEQMFYRRVTARCNGNEAWVGKIRGFPFVKGPWCNRDLKLAALKKAEKLLGGDDVVSYIGIAIDEPERLSRLNGTRTMSPLAAVGWTEKNCYQWCVDNDLLSPIYETSKRGGCWFCHNQGIDQLRLLRHNYPDLWKLLLAWDIDSPVTFATNGHTVHDYDRRFELEEQGKVPADRRFRWRMLDENRDY